MLLRPLLAEFVGTFCLVFVGTGAIVVNQVSGGQITHVGIAMTFGLIVFAMIMTFGDVSGCHINPAVTVGLVLARRFPIQCVLPYIVSQSVGALTASVVLQWLFPHETKLGNTQPYDQLALTAFIMEAVLTAMLMVTILFTTIGDQDKRRQAAWAIGAVIMLEAMMGGPISGASMNPARSLGPAVVTGDFRFLWVYWVAPITGVIVGVLLASLIQPKVTLSKATTCP